MEDLRRPDFDYDKFENEILERLKSSDDLLGRDGLLTPLIKRIIEKSLEGELDYHLKEERRSNQRNRRNGKSHKKMQSSLGPFELETPRDREGNFEPELVRKRETRLGNSIENHIISLYAIGMSYRDISKHLEETYGVEVSPAFLSSVTDRVLPEIAEWQSRTLDPVYAFVWMDAVHFKVRHEGKIKTRAVYVVLGLDIHGKKQLLGLYLGEAEGARFWLQVLTDLSNRGVRDILIASIDNLNGFSEAIESIYPQTEVQLCVIHQIRNSLKYVAHKDKSAFMEDLKKVYKADTKVLAEKNLESLEQNWGEKYPVVIRSWRQNWLLLSNYFKYSEQIRRIMYTTNIIEGYNKQLRKVTKNKGAFSSEAALMKLLFLASMKISEKWSAPCSNWALVISQLAIHFADRLKVELPVILEMEKN